MPQIFLIPAPKNFFAKYKVLATKINNMMRTILFTFLFCFLILGLGCKKYRPLDFSLSPTLSLVEEDHYYTLFPNTLCDTGNCAKVGVMFYPGANVKPKAYAEMLSLWAEAGYRCVMFKMPADFAVLAPQRAIKCMEEFPEIEQWVIVGHSLGGAMAASAVEKNPDVFDGLILLASYPGKSIKTVDIPVLSISAEFDMLTTRQDIEESKEDLPDNTQFVEIAGGNHAQFGSYGEQKKDGDATITANEQHQKIAEVAIPFLDAL
jgi:Alpha/beta hydrolase family